MKNQALIGIRGVTKEFGRVRALDDVTLQVLSGTGSVVAAAGNTGAKLELTYVPSFSGYFALKVVSASSTKLTYTLTVRLA